MFAGVFAFLTGGATGGKWWQTVADAPQLQCHHLFAVPHRKKIKSKKPDGP
jgi:hypothetical protein